MYASDSFAEAILGKAVDIVNAGGEQLFSDLATLPEPIYVTDAEGVIRYFNPACVDFAGRTPVVGEDRWCVTWKLYTEVGEFLPHDCCPMAQAIKDRQPVRGVVALAERPDGTRVAFMPYPTPLFDPDGEFRGAVNMLIDVTDRRQAASLQMQAERCRRLARTVNDVQTTSALTYLAEEYEAKARLLASH